MLRKLSKLLTSSIISGLLLTICGSALEKSTLAADGFQVFVPIIVNGDSHFTPPVFDPTENSWAMAGANPERTSWTPEEVRGSLQPSWYRPIEPYILPRVQVIAKYGTLFISTAKGLYALNAANGDVIWIYPTEMPLGHSPTVHNGVVYVGGFDRKIHAIDAFSGVGGPLPFEAGAGFDTNPLVIGDKLYAGNRDGFFYAIYIEGDGSNIKIGDIAWKYKTDGPIHFSAAYKDGVVYFASNDSYAYALNANEGYEIWDPVKLPGAGFHSWWPVVYKDWVVLAGSHNYRQKSPGPVSMRDITVEGVLPNAMLDPIGTLIGPLGTAPGDWVAGTPTIDTSQPAITTNGSTNPITEYYEEFPWRRTYFVLNRATGEEYTTDFDGDGKLEYAPILWWGNDGTENRYPPIVGIDGMLYQTNWYKSAPYIPGGQVSGWQIGSPYISIITSDHGAMDEPHAYSGGGSLIYWNLCCDRQAGAVDITIPYTDFLDRHNSGISESSGVSNQNREWVYFSYNLPDLLPGYNIMTLVSERYDDPYGGVYGGRNGSYGWHGDLNPPVPYQDHVYMIRSNAIVAFGPEAGNPISLPLVDAVEAPDNQSQIDSEQIRDNLVAEVEKIINTEHLLPGYVSSGIFDNFSHSICGDDLVDYWHNPGDILYTLLLALPHLPEDMHEQTKAYIQREFNAYLPYSYNHIGWRDGISRTPFDFPPEVENARLNAAPSAANYSFIGWRLNPNTFYVLWKYANVFGGAQEIFEASKDKLAQTPNNEVLAEMPHVHNAFIAGYFGYLQLEKLAGHPESNNVKSELDRLFVLRAAEFTKDSPDVFFQDPGRAYCRALNTSRNFLYLVPELSDYLREHAYFKVKEAIDEYEQIAPYWFVSQSETAFGEAVISPLYDTNSLFQAKALIVNASQKDLIRYIDVPAFQIGDLFYIQNIIATLESSSTPNE